MPLAGLELEVYLACVAALLGKGGGGEGGGKEGPAERPVYFIKRP